MPSTLDIRRRIRSVKSTRQITRAMEMVSAAKMRRAVEAALNTRTYAQLAQELLVKLSKVQKDKLPLLAEKEKKKKQEEIDSKTRDLEEFQRDAEMGHGLLESPPVGFAGEEKLVSVAFKAAAQVRLAAGVGPGGLEVIDARGQGRLDDGLGLAVVAEGPQNAFASQAQPGGGVPGAPQGFLG